MPNDDGSPSPGGTTIALDTGEIKITGSNVVFTVHGHMPGDHPMYHKIGRVAAEWAMLEHVLDLTIWEISELTQPVGACITSQIMGATNRYGAIIGLCKHLPSYQKYHPIYIELMNSGYKMQEDRNRIVHDPWFVEQSTKASSQLRSMPRKELRFGFVERNDAYIQSVLDTIEHRVERLLELWSSIRDERAAIARKTDSAISRKSESDGS